MKDWSKLDTPIPERTHITGANTSIRRTITPCSKVREIEWKGREEA